MRSIQVVLVAVLVLFMGCSKPSKLIVPAADDAKRIVFKFLELKVLAEQGFSVSGLLALESDVEGFGKTGTRFWEVRRTNLHLGGNIDGLYWVNAETGVVLQVHPNELRDTKSPDKNITSRSISFRAEALHWTGQALLELPINDTLGGLAGSPKG
jgi:hypothetical protein